MQLQKDPFIFLKASLSLSSPLLQKTKMKMKVLKLDIVTFARHYHVFTTYTLIANSAYFPYLDRFTLPLTVKHRPPHIYMTWSSTPGDILRLVFRFSPARAVPCCVDIPLDVRGEGRRHGIGPVLPLDRSTPGGAGQADWL